jgi:hypothetical protein
MKMKKFLTKLFADENDINEKSVVGFCAFVMMTIFAIADIITGTLGKQLIITEFIFNSFMIITLGSFGIASVDKWIVKKHSKQGHSNEEAQPNE